MKRYFIFLFMCLCTLSSIAKDEGIVKDSLIAENRLNRWGKRLKKSPFHLGVDLQTKYVWRGMEMITEDAVPVLFPSIGYGYKNFYIFSMGGYSLNGKYAEVDFGVSYTWKGLTIGLNDYYYPTVDNVKDKYFSGGENTKHWFEICMTYQPEKIPLWLTVSNFFAGNDKYMEDNNTQKQAYSTYCEIGTFCDFLDNNRIQISAGIANKSCYNQYKKDFSVTNIELKYIYNLAIRKDVIIPIGGSVIYSPLNDKLFFNLSTHLGF